MPERAPLHSTQVRTTLAAAAVAVLVAGYALRPQAELPPTAVEQQPSPILREVVTRRQTIGMFAALQDTARVAVSSTARLVAPPAPLDRWSDWQPAPRRNDERFAVPIDAARLLGDAADLAEGVAVDIRLGNGRTLRGAVQTRFPASRLALIATDTTEPLPVPAAAATPALAGDVVVAVAPGGEGPITVPLIVTEVERRTMRVTGGADRFIGMAVFAAGGDWVGVLAADADGFRVLPVDLVFTEPSAPAAVAPPIGVSLRAAMRADHVDVVVDDVAAQGQAAAAGLRAGDVLVEIDGTPLVDLESAVAALQTGAPVRVRVRRGTRMLTIRIAAAGETP